MLCADPIALDGGVRRGSMNLYLPATVSHFNCSSGQTSYSETPRQNRQKVSVVGSH